MPENHDKDRLPPGQYLTRDLPVAHVGQIPHFDPSIWTFRIQGLVEAPLTLGYEEFRAQSRVKRVLDLHCVATWSRYDLEWEGIPVRRLIHTARPMPEARFVLVHADGGYTTSLPIDAFDSEDVLVADGLNGEPLAPEHGFPARLVVPDRYAYKSAKWVRALELLAEDRPGFWESRGYSSSALAFAEERFAPLPPPDEGK